MTPATKGILAMVGIVGVSVGVVLVVLSAGSSGTTPSKDVTGGRSGGAASGGAVPDVIIDNGGPVSIDPLRPDYRVELLSIPSFSQENQDGATVTNDVFTGRVTVVSFFFTRCTFICPVLTGAMIEVMKRLEGTPTRFVSFTVDPEHDTPVVMKKYAAEHGADFTRWTFLSGKKAQTWSLLRDGLKWGIEEREEERILLGDGTSISNIRHPGWFALVGPDGRVLGIYQSSDDAQIGAIVERARAATARLKARG